MTGTWLVYRERGRTMAKTITAALAAYTARHNAQAPCIRVPRSQVAEATALAPSGVNVEGNGGTLRGEVWLWEPEAVILDAQPPAWTQIPLL